jgi:hypothetical protein
VLEIISTATTATLQRTAREDCKNRPFHREIWTSDQHTIAEKLCDFCLRKNQLWIIFRKFTPENIN